MKKIIISLLIATMFLTGCSLGESKDKSETNNKPDKETTEDINDTSKEKDTTVNEEDTVNKDETNKSEEEDFSQTNSNNTSQNSNGLASTDISEKVKDYIINGQNDKSEAEKYKWSTRFLNEVDIESLYNQYISAGNNAENIEDFAKYITLNAPILSNWEELFKSDLKETYGEEVVKLEHLEGDLYQA